MRRTKRNIIYHELTGLELIVKDHACESLKGLKGRVVYETMKTIEVLGTDGRVRKVPKLGGVFLFKLGKHHVVEVRGDRILGRPEDRLRRFGGGT